MSNIPTTTNNNVLKNTNIYGGLAVLDNPSGSIGRVYVQRDMKIDGMLVVNDRLIDASFVDLLETIPSVDNKILIASQNVAQQANTYTDNKIAELIGTADDSLNSIQELANAIQSNASLVDSIYSVIGSKATLGEVQTYLGINYYDKPTIDTKLSQTLTSAQTYTSQSISPILSDIANLKIKVNNKISYTDMLNYVTQNTYSKTEVDTKSIDTLSQANQYTNTAIQNITGYETTTSVNSKLENLQLQLNQKANINNPTFSGTVSGISKAMVGLGSVNNTSDLSKPISTATQTALNLKANVNNPSFTGTVSGITKTMVGLSNVDNTADINKPISTATQNALDLKANIVDPTFTNNITVNGTLSSFGNLKINTDSTQTKYLSFSKSNEVFGYYRDTTTNVWGFDGNGNLFTLGGITAQNSSTFNKTITISEDAPNMNLLLTSKSKPSRLFFLSGSNAGNYNPIAELNDSSIVYDNGALGSGALNICGWANSSNGLKLTSNLTKVFGNFEVSNGSFVGSPIFRPTGNSAFGLGNNVFNSSALLQPLIYNGIANGNGNGASYSQFNVSFNSWNGTGFVCTANNTCNAFLDHTNGNFSTKGNLICNNITASGSLSLTGNLNMNNSDVFARSMALSNNLFVTNAYVSGLTNISGNLQVGGNLTLSSGIINSNKTTKITNMATFIPNYILDYSFPKTLGTTNLLAGYMSVTDFQKSISLTIPLSVFRQYRNISTSNMTNYLEDAITSVSYVINKNNQFFASGTCSATETLPKMVSVMTSNSTASRNYEIYITNVGLSFTPTYEIGTTAIYTIILNVNYRLNITNYAASNLIIENFGYYANTELATSNIQVYSSSGPTASGAYYAPTSFTLGFVPNSYYTEGNGLVKTDSVVANTAYVRDTFTTNSLTTQKATFNDKVVFNKQVVCSEPVVLNNGIAGYHIDGLANYISTPVFCSMRSFGRPNTDDFWFVNPGYRIEIYNSNDYLVWIKTMDNTNGTSAVVYALNDTERNRTESFRVFFLNKEVAIWPLS